MWGFSFDSRITVKMSGDFVLYKQIIMHLDVLTLSFMNIHAKLHPL